MALADQCPALPPPLPLSHPHPIPPLSSPSPPRIREERRQGHFQPDPRFEEVKAYVRSGVFGKDEHTMREMDMLMGSLEGESEKMRARVGLMMGMRCTAHAPSHAQPSSHTTHGHPHPAPSPTPLTPPPPPQATRALAARTTSASATTSPPSWRPWTLLMPGTATPRPGRVLRSSTPPRPASSPATAPSGSTPRRSGVSSPAAWATEKLSANGD